MLKLEADVPTITLSLSDHEVALASWAINAWAITFEQVVARGYLRKAPPAPVVDSRMLRLPLNVDSLEELDYQLTIGVRDCPNEWSITFDPAVGDRLARRIQAHLPGHIRLAV